MRRNDAYLLDMLVAARATSRTVHGLSYEQFSGNDCHKAVLFDLGIIDRAASRVDEDGRKAYPEIPWQRLAGLKDRLENDRFVADLEKTWEAVNRDILPLIARLERIVPPEGDQQRANSRNHPRSGAGRPAPTNSESASRTGVPAAVIAEFCKRWRVAQMALFGSVLRDDFADDSDIDVLVDFEPEGENISAYRFIDMAEELEQIFKRPVDLLERSVVEKMANYIRRDSILESAEVIYAAK